MLCSVKVCGISRICKLRVVRAKSMKFTDGFMIYSGRPTRDFVPYAVCHVLLHQGAPGIKLKLVGITHSYNVHRRLVIWVQDHCRCFWTDVTRSASRAPTLVAPVAPTGTPAHRCAGHSPCEC
jgi:hypothetical protein